LDTKRTFFFTMAERLRCFGGRLAESKIGYEIKIRGGNGREQAGRKDPKGDSVQLAPTANFAAPIMFCPGVGLGHERIICMRGLVGKRGTGWGDGG